MLDVKVLNDAIKAADISLEKELLECLEMPFDEVGLDSLDLFNLFLELEEVTGIVIPDDEVESFENFKSILEAYK